MGTCTQEWKIGAGGCKDAYYIPDAREINKAALLERPCFLTNKIIKLPVTSFQEQDFSFQLVLQQAE